MLQHPSDLHMCKPTYTTGLFPHTQIYYKGNAIHFQGLLLNLTKPFPNVCITSPPLRAKRRLCMRYTVVFCFPKAAWGGKNRSKPAEGTMFGKAFCVPSASLRQ